MLSSPTINERYIHQQSQEDIDSMENNQKLPKSPSLILSSSTRFDPATTATTSTPTTTTTSKYKEHQEHKFREQVFFHTGGKRVGKISNIGDANEIETQIGDVASEIVPFLPKLSDVVALFSCASPLRDGTSAVILEEIANHSWKNKRPQSLTANNTNNNEGDQTNFGDYSVHAERTQEDEALFQQMNAITSAEMIRHVIFHSAKSATSCSKIRKVDVSITNELLSVLRQAAAKNFINSQNEEDLQENFLSNEDLINICKWCPNMEELIADGNYFSLFGEPEISNSNNNKETNTRSLLLSSSSSPSSFSTPQKQQNLVTTTGTTSVPSPYSYQQNNTSSSALVGASAIKSSLAPNISFGISEFGLFSACVCLARTEHLTRISLRHIPLEDLKGLALVKTLESVDCSLNAKLNAGGLKPLSELPNLKEVILIRCTALGSVDGLASSPSITKLDISACPVSNIEHLATDLKTLKWLRADATRIEDGLIPLKFSTSLEWISLRNVRAGEEQLEALGAIPTLKHVCIYNAKVETVDFLQNFSTIESLDIGMLNVRRADFRGEEGNMPRLTRLCMRHCPVVETIYMQRQWSTSMVVLDLMNASQLGDDGLQVLGEGLPNLTSLNLAGTAVSDITVENEITLLTKLQFLDLSNTAVSSVSCLVPDSCGNNEENNNNNKNNIGCPDLKILKLECCRSFPAFRKGGGMKGLGNLQKLEELHIGCTSVRDMARSGNIFEPWPSLKILDCSGLMIPPREFETFCLNCPKLRKLILTVRQEDNGSNSWKQVADAIRTSRYIEVLGI